MATNQRAPEMAAEVGLIGDTERAETEALWIRVRVDRQQKDSCPVANFRDQDVSGEVQLIGNQCHMTIREERSRENPQLVTTTIDESCTCAVVCEPGISPTDISIEEGSLQLEAVVNSRDRLQQLSNRLNETDSVWHLQKLLPVSEYSQDSTNPVADLKEEISLTEKQREVVQVAVRRGYYANPREATLGELAEEIGVTRSALSQRLNAVEAKLIDTLAADL